MLVSNEIYGSIMISNIFDYIEYKDYICEIITNSSRYGRGTQKDMAKFLECKTSYISQVLNGYLDFTLEQGVKLNVFFDHTEEESHYFILQIQYARAGSRELKLHFEKQMKMITDNRHVLTKRLKPQNTLNENFKHIYYSTWYYAAIHIMLTIPQYCTVDSIVTALSLPRPLIVKVLDFLVTCGLAVQDNGIYKNGISNIHLTSESPHIQRHHTNLRNQAIQSIDKNLPDDLHYSSFISLAKEDVIKIRELLIQTIEEYRKVVKNSPPEELHGICIDFFKLL